MVGGGLAGLYAALHLPPDWSVLVVDKGTDTKAGSSPLAQGGMAVPIGPGDSPALHAADTVRVGAGACVEDAVAVLTEEAPAQLEELVALGCEFDRGADGSLDLNREGGQSVPRSVHAKDATGRELMRVVVDRARTRATRMVGAAVELLVQEGRCVGALVREPDGSLVPVTARAVLLATGGCGALYEATTNTSASTGDGVALAYLAGAAVADVEFVQFHPTTLAAGDGQRVLMTEALRGDGAFVVDADGERFLLGVHPDGELAPRDVVARAIAARERAFLDARHLGADALAERFPNVLAAVRECGFDLAREVVPVSPAAHYFLGGVATDLDGRTSLPGLFAAGECAATGVHGANRMAGNSLTEAVVYGRRAAIAMTSSAGESPGAFSFSGGASRNDPDGWREVRRAMTAGAGLSRTAESLDSARRVAEDIAGRSPDAALRLAATTASLICRAATSREESRGVHFRSDHPDRLPPWDGRHIELVR
ncbi:MAG: L-aspartate oxidase [Actinomycetota bacterium]